MEHDDTEPQKRRIVQLLASMARSLARPVILIDGQEEHWPSQEQIRRAVAAGFPILHVHFGTPEHGQRKGTDALEGS
jgi:hypothetical protein